jgi:opacity protein-like surface antigen
MNKAIVIGLFTLLVLQAKAQQERNTVTIKYQYALPMGDFKNNLIGNGSPRGGTISILHALNPKWRVGGTLGYQDFYQKDPRNTYQMDDGSDISAVVSNSLQTTPLMATGVFQPLGADSSRLQPYILAGAGINMVQYSQLLGEFNNGDDVWLRFAAQAGAGVSYTLGAAQRAALVVGLAYNYMPLNRNSLKNANNLAVQAGIRFGLRNTGQRSQRGDVWQQRSPNHYNRGW